MKKLLILVLCYTLSCIADAQDCSTLNMAAQDENTTIDERLEAAKQYKNCITIENAKTPNEMFVFKSTPMAVDAHEQVDELKGKKSFLGQNFGVGFGVSFYKDEIIDDADIVNGVVVAKSNKSEEARVLLEFHTLIACNNSRKSADFGCGPFAAIAAKDNDILGGIGLGWLWSWRNKGSNDGTGFSVGIGAIVDNDVRDLADGFKVGEAPPDGETAIRYTDETKISYLLFISNSF
jgi:hypothetical protein